MSDDADDIARIAERLRKDHPDAAERAKLYARPHGLREYVLALGISDDARADRIATAVRASVDP